eukprot:9492889-Pyramimonas_sp.AAC.1
MGGPPQKPHMHQRSWLHWCICTNAAGCTGASHGGVCTCTNAAGCTGAYAPMQPAALVHMGLRRSLPEMSGDMQRADLLPFLLPPHP